MQETQTVRDFEYTEADAERLATQPRLREGMFELAVVDVDNDDNKTTNNMQINLTAAPVNDAGAADESVTTYYSLTIPLVNPRVSGHKLADDVEKKASKRAEKFIRAIEPGYLPTWFQKNDAGVYVNEDGQPVTALEKKARNKAIKVAMLAKLKEWYRNPKALLRGKFYAMVTAPDASDFSNIFWVTDDPKDLEVIRTDFKKQ